MPISLAMLTLSSPTVAWGRGHSIIRSWAVAQLPDWQQRSLAPVAEKLTRDCLSLQDTYAGSKDPALAPYCDPANAQVSLHDVVDPVPAGRGMVWYLERVTDCWQAERWDDAARYLGVLCHWLEDPGSPSAHALHCVGITEAMLRDLLPPPADKAKFAYTYGHHGIADTGQYTIPADARRTPRLLGATILEAAFALLHGQRRVARLARAMVLPMLSAQLHANPAEADLLRGEQARLTAELVADALYTALCLATGRIDPAEARACDGLPVAGLEFAPFRGKAGEPYVWVPFLIGQSLDARRAAHPLAVLGRAAPFETGLGMGAPATAELPFAPAGAWARLTATIGLHPAAGPKGAVQFVLQAGGQELYRSPTIRSGEPGVAVDVTLPEGELGLLALTTEPVDGSESSPDNQCVWGEPRLWRG